jgi:hypothetical protein
MTRIAAQYESEAANRRGAEPRFGEDVVPGDSLLTLVKGPLTITGIVGWILGWGSPLCPTNRLAHEYLKAHPGATLHNDQTNISDTLEGAHWDAHFARQSGLPSGYDFGGQRISWMAHMLSDWMGDVARLRDLDVRLRRPNLLGDTSWVNGKVIAKEEGADSDMVSCEVQVTNQNDEVTTTGTAMVELPTRRRGVEAFLERWRSPSR